MNNITIDFSELVNEHVNAIYGRDAGKKFAKNKQVLKHLDEENLIIINIDPNKVKAINDSFIKGFFSEVFEKYKSISIIEKKITINTDDFYKNLILKNWSILESIVN